jgi:hypothetical protein
MAVTTRAVNYRDKAHQLRGEAVLAPNKLLHDQLASLAAQYDQLAENLERALVH